eukprot:CAMPEP_0118955996 /NCGR_PEP_ID=MMETSP1169-20130426/60873_1 /TAXON_ID=36882 /ORGANISM="Pyramimonas obovata, Strain CCMP722" /LENGTH=748 /DNA_ID=CAMNT_0006903939 /DNA_START=199 /DNA_END=2441 /DNA_ORIENTATION=-
MRALKLQLLQLFTVYSVLRTPAAVRAQACITNSAQATESFNSSTASGIWSHIPTTAPEARWGHAMTFGQGNSGNSTGSHIYVYGGESVYYRTCFKDLWRLDLDTVRWEKVWGREVCTDTETNSEAGDVPESVQSPTLAYLEPNVLVVFGGKSCNINNAMGGAWVFSLTELSWSSLHESLSVADESPVKRWMHTAVVLPGVDGSTPTAMYLHGGVSSTRTGATALSDFWRLEVEQQGSYKWTRLPDSPFGLWAHASAGYGSYVLSHGGSTGGFALNPDSFSARLLRYDTLENSWTELRPSSRGAAMHSAFIAHGTVGADWVLETAVGEDASEAERPLEKQPLLHVLGGLQDLTSFRTDDAFKGSSDRPQEELLTEVFDLATGSWYVETNLTWQTSPPLVWLSAVAAKWQPTQAPEGDESVAWLFGGKQMVAYSDWTASLQGHSGSPEQVESVFQFHQKEQEWSRMPGQVAARRDHAAVVVGGGASGVPAGLLVHGGWVSSATASQLFADSGFVDSVHNDAMLWADLDGGPDGAPRQWHDLEAQNGALPRIGHTLVPTGDPLTTVLFGGLEMATSGSSPAMVSHEHELRQLVAVPYTNPASGRTEMTADWSSLTYPYAETFSKSDGGYAGEDSLQPAWVRVTKVTDDDGLETTLTNVARRSAILSPELYMDRLTAPRVSVSYNIAMHPTGQAQQLIVDLEVKLVRPDGTAVGTASESRQVWWDRSEWLTGSEAELVLELGAPVAGAVQLR